MATKLQNSMFIHIPKTGGRWVNNMLFKAVKGAESIGDPIYDAHDSPDIDLPVFAFVRHPIELANSLWCHRSRKHSNTRHKDWNWQQDIEFERVCGDSDYNKYFENVAANPKIITSYYYHFIGKYKKVRLGRMETIAEDLVKILINYEESFNEDFIRANAMNKIGSGSDQINLPKDIYNQIMKNEEDFCLQFGYTEQEEVNAS